MKHVNSDRLTGKIFAEVDILASLAVISERPQFPGQTWTTVFVAVVDPNPIRRTAGENKVDRQSANGWLVKGESGGEVANARAHAPR